MITTLTQKLWKKIRAGTAALCLLSACGDETKLVHYDAPPLPRAVDPREVGKMPPRPPETPSINFNVTFQHCLGPIAEYDSFEEVCPKNRETGQCDEYFTRVLQENKNALETLIREDATIDPLDLLDGEVSIPTTAIAWYDLYGTEHSPDLAEIGVRGNLFYTATRMHVTFGNNVATLQEYLQNGTYGFDNFPINHLYCAFGREEDSENPEYTLYTLHLMYQKEGEYVIDLLLSYRDMPHPAPRDHRATLIDYYAGEVFQYPPEEFDIGVTAYAIEDFQQSGEERVRELLNIGAEDIWENGLFYWE